MPEQHYNEFARCSAELIVAGQSLYAQGMVPATSGNFSARLSNGDIAITVSGRHKGRMTDGDIMRADANGKSLDGQRSSAETALHVQIYNRFPSAMVVLHPHSVNATLLSRLNGEFLVLQDYELLKAFPGIESHDGSITVPIFENDQNIDRLAKRVEQYCATEESMHGYLINGHGFYTWGDSIEDALRHVEAFEFLFECELRMRGIR